MAASKSNLTVLVSNEELGSGEKHRGTIKVNIQMSECCFTPQPAVSSYITDWPAHNRVSGRLYLLNHIIYKIVSINIRRLTETRCLTRTH